MALFKGNSGQQLSLRLSSLLHAGKTCRQQLRMLHLRQNDLSEIMAGLDLGWVFKHHSSFVSQHISVIRSITWSYLSFVSLCLTENLV